MGQAGRDRNQGLRGQVRTIAVLKQSKGVGRVQVVRRFGVDLFIDAEQGNDQLGHPVPDPGDVDCDSVGGEQEVTVDAEAQLGGESEKSEKELFVGSRLARVFVGTVLAGGMLASTIFADNTLADTILAGAIFASTILGSTILASTLLASTLFVSTLLVSTLPAGAILAGAILASTIFADIILWLSLLAWSKATGRLAVGGCCGNLPLGWNLSGHLDGVSGLGSVWLMEG